MALHLQLASPALLKVILKYPVLIETVHWKVRNSVLLGPPYWKISRTFVTKFQLVLYPKSHREHHCLPYPP